MKKLIATLCALFSLMILVELPAFAGVDSLIVRMKPDAPKGHNHSPSGVPYAREIELVAEFVMTVDVRGWDNYPGRSRDNQPYEQLAIILRNDTLFTQILDMTIDSSSTPIYTLEMAVGDTLRIVPMSGSQFVKVKWKWEQTPFPVEYLYVEGKVKNGTNIIDWATSQEVNSSHFVIRRSQDLRSWTNLGRLEAQKYSDKIVEYSFTDSSVGEQGRYFYQLIQVDLDGAVSLSSIVEMNNYEIAKSDFEISTDYKTGLPAVWNLSSEKGYVNIISLSDAKIVFQTTVTNDGIIFPPSIAKGWYACIIKSGSIQKTTKFFIQ